MPHYRVVIDAELVTKAKTRAIIVNRVRKMFRQADFDIKDYEWSVAYVTPKEAEGIEAVLARRKEPTP